MSEERRVSWAKKVIWNFTSVSNGILAILLGYLNFYLTQNLLLSAGAVGVWLMASKVFDGFTDLVAGYIIERVNTRWGKGRPWQIFSAILWIIVIFIFAVPSFFSTTGKLVYVFVCYTIIQSVCQTMSGVADQVYMMRAMPNEHDRASACAIGGVLTTYVCAGFSMVMPLLVSSLTTRENGWMLLAITLGIPCAILALIKVIVVNEYPLTDAQGNKVKQEKVTLKQMINSLIHNKYGLLCFGLVLFYYLSQNLNTAVQAYYFTYNMGNLKLASAIQATAIITPIFLLFIPKLQDKYGKAKVIKAGLIVNLISCIVRFFASTNMIVLVVTTIGVAFGTLPYIYFAGLFLMDAMDYGEWKMGYRVESIYSSVSNTANKISAGLASGLSGIYMEFTGFVSGAETQSKSALDGIYVLFIIVPIILGLILLVLLHFYDLDDKIEKIKEELKVKRSQKISK